MESPEQHYLIPILVSRALKLKQPAWLAEVSIGLLYWPHHAEAAPIILVIFSSMMASVFSVLSPQHRLPGSAAWKTLGLGNGYG